MQDVARHLIAHVEDEGRDGEPGDRVTEAEAQRHGR